jgi:sugar O-acyltransferase (sialic acid O-acetyltransferase NeuD family)
MSDAQTGSACVVLGGGQHAKVVIDALLTAGLTPPCAILDADRSRWGTVVLGVPIVGGDECLPRLVRIGVTEFTVGVGSTNDTRLRQRLYELGLRRGLTPVTIRHPTAICSPTARLGAGAQILAAAVVNTAAVVGDNAIINTAAVVEHDCLIGRHAHVATGARLAGAVRVGEGAHIGIGATIKQGLTIGPHSVVGAGAVVVRDVGDEWVVIGVPARQLRQAAA